METSVSAGNKWLQLKSLQNVLRHSGDLSFNDLCLLAKKLFGDSPGQKSRKDILTRLALHFGEDFAELVLESDGRLKTPAQCKHVALVKAVFDMMDADERKEFRSIKENMDKAEKAKTQVKWRDLLNEKLSEQKASRRSFALNFIFIARTAANLKLVRQRVRTFGAISELLFCHLSQQS